MIVYAARNFITGKVYIGSTIQSLTHRKHKHESKSRDPALKRPMYVDMRDLGIESFEWKKLLDCESREQMLAYESEIIDLLETHKTGYNINIDGGSNRGGSQAESTKAKQSAWRIQWHKSQAERVWPKRAKFRAIMEPNKDAILLMREAGNSYLDIAKVFNCCPSTVCCAIKRWKAK